MLRDVFYFNKKPNAHPRERYATDLNDARNKSTTEHFWVINEFCDYTEFDWDFDFSFLSDEDVWAEEHNNVWPSLHQKDSGTWLCPRIHSDIIVYRPDVEPLRRKTDIDTNWVFLENIDVNHFDLSWHPDPTDPPYIYRWGCTHFPVNIQPVLEYRVPGATSIKYMDDLVLLLPSENLVEHIKVDRTKFDISWRPDPREPAYIYVWGNKYDPPEVKPTLEYHVPGATEKKYMGILDLEPEWDRWVEYQKIDRTRFDMSWRPDPNLHEPPYIYVWGNKWISGELKPTLEYHVPGATEKKYMEELVPVLPDNNWIEHQKVDRTRFDMSWRPDPREPAYIYVWGNKWIPAEIQPTLEYFMHGATQRKYMSETIPVLPDENWVEHQNVDKKRFDMSWRPDPREPAYIYVWGNKWIPGEIKPTLEYRVPGATEKKYMEELISVLPDSNWIEHQKIDKNKFDMSWRPDPREPAYIYVWGNRWISGELKPTLEYHTPGATEKKYMTELLEVLPDNNWIEHQKIDKKQFDLSWRPDPREPAYIYVWGNKWIPAEIQPTLEYHTPGATEKKYMQDSVPVLPDKNWVEYILVDRKKFDMSWRPDPREPDYIYVWGNCFDPPEVKSTLEYRVPGATQKKYMGILDLEPEWDRWVEHQKVDRLYFDFSWRPDPNLHEPPYIYVWGNKYISAELKPTLEYHVPGATQRKYMTELLEVSPEWDRWQTDKKFDDFDFTWRPDPREYPFIYQFGTVLDKNDGPRYITPENKGEIKYLEYIKADKNYMVKKYVIESNLDELVRQHPDELFWAIRKNIDYSRFDFDWRPDKIDTEFENKFVHVFGSSESEVTQTYFVNSKMYLDGYTDFKFVENKKLDDTTLAELFVKPDMFFIDRSNAHSDVRFNQIKQRFPNIQKTRFLNSWVDTINRCINKSTTELCWIISSEVDYSDFDFFYYPNPWQMKMVHVFGSQWNHWGNTYLVNKETFGKDTKYIKVIEHLNNLNFVRNKKAKVVDCLYDVYLIDHGNGTETVKSLLEQKIGKSVTTISYKNDYLETFKCLVDMIPEKKENFIWVCSSICDYHNFDFSYICDPFSKEHLHVFPSNRQKFGDTFLVNVNTLKSLLGEVELLEKLKRINFNQHQVVPRLPAPTFVSKDTHIDFAKQDFKFPYAIFKTHDNVDINIEDIEPISLWAQKSKNIVIKSTGGSCVVIPEEAKNYVKTELYDYLYIKSEEKLTKSNPLDIVFFSNGETGADKNYEYLLEMTKRLPNRVIRIDGVKGRVNSQRAAADSANTPWYFLINAKLRVNERFDFNWQPDRLQIPKHYIFHATNPVNGLEYGHQAIVANNKNLTLNTIVKGLDFTMDSDHEVVKVNSGIGIYNTSEWDTWRTAFRETIKLRYNNSKESNERLDVWLNVATGDYAQYSLQGAKDALEYFNQVDGNLEKLMLSYDWAWLREYYDNRYK